MCPDKFMTFIIPATAIRNAIHSAIISQHAFGSVAEWVAMCNLLVTIAVDQFQSPAQTLWPHSSLLLVIVVWCVSFVS